VARIKMVEALAYVTRVMSVILLFKK